MIDLPSGKFILSIKYVAGRNIDIKISMFSIYFDGLILDTVTPQNYDYFLTNSYEIRILRNNFNTNV